MVFLLGSLRHVRRLARRAIQAFAGRCAFRNERACRNATGILSLGSFHGKIDASDFGASMMHSIAITYGCGGESSGMTSTGVWHECTTSRGTLWTKSPRGPSYIALRKRSTISGVMPGRCLVSGGIHVFM